MADDPYASPESMIFDANLEEFGSRVGVICALETGGKISAAEAYEQIKDIWKQLKRSKKNLLEEQKQEGDS